ncbi:hypothetical protein GH714_018095 [Hevea brasiliensis]|uniref:Pectinesterase n=1 Tax=Hevea brasiliensis TaxID=3981 RepID=A0A6A6N1Z5_HEVBR|nr:hypothetical protein GH714_018095 [Hevea brasiliensis]
MALDDCQELLENAMQELQVSYSLVNGSDLSTINERSAQLQSWLSSVLAYQETCVDNFEDHSIIKPLIRMGMIDASHRIDNALAILSTSSMSPSPTTIIRPKALAGFFLLVMMDIPHDDSGQFVNISAALSAYPKHLKGRYVIYVKAGIYHEHVTVTRKHPNVFIYGDGPKKTIVIGKKSFASGVNTWRTATFGFANTAGLSGRHAVALRVDSDMSAFFNCRMDGYQNTLLYQAKRQFYRNCVISGTIDFIFGYGAAVIQNSLIIVRRPRTNQKNTVTADGRKEEHATTGLVIHNCRIVPEKKLVPHSQRDGWLGQDFYTLTLCTMLNANTGPGANTNRRVRWKNFHVIDRNEAHQFTAGEFLHGAEWIKRAGVPVLLGLRG